MPQPAATLPDWLGGCRALYLYLSLELKYFTAKSLQTGVQAHGYTPGQCMHLGTQKIGTHNAQPVAVTALALVGCLDPGAGWPNTATTQHMNTRTKRIASRQR